MLIVNFLIETLVITNGWVFVYTRLLRYLNAAIPPSDPSQNFIRMPIEFAPEPYEIPLYLSLTFFTIILVFLYYRFVAPFIKQKIHIPINPQLLSVMKILSLFVLGGFFLYNLGKYPLAHEIPPYQKPIALQTRQLTLFFYLLTSSLILIESAILQNVITKSKKTFILFSSLVIGLLFIVTFEPRFPMFVLDYSLIFGPVWEVAQGKTIYTQVPSLY